MAKPRKQGAHPVLREMANREVGGTVATFDTAHVDFAAYVAATPGIAVGTNSTTYPRDFATPTSYRTAVAAWLAAQPAPAPRFAVVCPHGTVTARANYGATRPLAWHPGGDAEHAAWCMDCAAVVRERVALAASVPPVPVASSPVEVQDAQPAPVAAATAKATGRTRKPAAQPGPRANRGARKA
jgi:hypothetical protein